MGAPALPVDRRPRWSVVEDEAEQHVLATLRGSRRPTSRSGLGRRHLGERGVGRSAELESSPSERDRAQGEPGPTDGETGDDVGDPVHTKEDTGAGHRHRYPHRDPVRSRAIPRRPSQAHDECHGSVARRRGRGVAAGERSAAEAGEDGNGRAGAVDEDLDEIDDRGVPPENEANEQDRRDAPRSKSHDHGQDRPHQDHRSGGSELRDRTERRCRERRRMRGPPQSNPEIGGGECGVRSQEVDQDPHQRAGADHEGQGEV